MRRPCRNGDLMSRRNLGTARGMARFRARLLSWEDTLKVGYPWRRTDAPYKILVSEFMLHRTQAKQVVPTYLEFIERYPTLEAFARGNRRYQRKLLDRLGLSWRSDGMIRALAALWVEHGRVPTEYDLLLAVPGIGQYIAGATICFSRDMPLPLVDSNIVRVIGRVFGMNLAGEARRRKDVLDLLSHALHPTRPREYHFALIDLAHAICRPRNPDCPGCPLRVMPCAYARASVTGGPGRGSRKSGSVRG